MNKRFDAILSERLRELPSRSPAVTLWEEIEVALDTEEAISKEIQHLPVHAPSPANWKWIESRLKEVRIADLRRRQLYIAAAAAAVLLLLTIPHLVRPAQEITVEDEIVLSEELSTAGTTGREDEDPIEVIKNLCKTGAPVCKSELFIEKMQLYRELNEELRQLEEVIGQIGDSPEIIQSVIRIENLKSGTIQELIQLIHS